MRINELFKKTLTSISALNILPFVLTATLLLSCSDDTTDVDGRIYTDVPTSLISDPAKLKMLQSIQDLDDGRFFYLDYTADYKLDLMKESSITTNAGLIGFVLRFAQGSCQCKAEL